MNKIRVRYAPSPTGFLHIGNARTALFNFLFACHFKGNFIIRIEDTDLKRNVDKSEQTQLQQLKWLGLKWSEGPDIGGNFGPYRQSERTEIYQKYANFLIEKKLAYKEYKDQTQKNNFVIRFKVPSNTKYEFNDLIRGKLSFQSKDIEDWIIIKENGFPTYNFAVTIDDHLMGISHVLRGEEHITNTPKQIMLYKSFEWDIPLFAHLSIILNKNKKKLSKRDNNEMQFIEKYISYGYLPEAVFNYLCLLGFSPSNDKTILSKQELIDLFNIKKLIKSPAIFDNEKLNFINSQYLKKMDSQQLVEQTQYFFNKNKINKNKEWITNFIYLFKNRLNNIQETITLYNDFFSKQEKLILNLNSEELSFLKEKNTLYNIKELYNMILKIKSLDDSSIEKLIKEFSEKTKLKGKNLFQTIRISCSGKTHGPDLYIFLKLLGKSQIIKNIEKIIKLIEL
ncbi:glutamate--tRNA ligase [Texas Phoenix palm phytoplasma]|uniref:Glutamate--tRNA ligase n=1 Tax=Texas Phoenix palm phytoplasma TaxID=176709 RepID=A0ABS5BIA7_9MOLU|nr:glutamate--tRNA ligase [Texas Phoenix palm phytoplasma]MBP3059312.1 glutamate--tRNA ligase [Texas Phoenix palm phytoplasma]